MRNIIRGSLYPLNRPYPSMGTLRRRYQIPSRINQCFIPLSVLEATSGIMQKFGKEERECYVWWSGYFTPNGEAQVLTALCPDVHTEFGRVHLETKEFSAMQSKLKSLDQVLIMELHTHPPKGGGQNEVDAAFPAATHKGFLSIIVPNFAFPKFYDLRTVFVYEHLGQKKWREWDREEIQKRLIVEETFCMVGSS